MEKHKQMLRGEDLFVDGLGIYVNRAIETFHIGFHFHDFIEIAYVAEGKGFHHIGDEIKSVSKGDVFVLPIGTAHVFRPEAIKGKQGLKVFNCVITQNVMSEAVELVKDIDLMSILQLQQTGASNYIAIHDDGYILEPIFQTMHREHATKQSGSAAILYTLLVQLLVLITRKCQAPMSSGFESRDDVIDQAIAYMQRNYAEKLSITQIAELCQMSERHFFRLFKHRTGQTFNDYVQHLRIQVSCDLLLEGNDKITVIAAAVGYRDIASFNQVFRRITGKTPSAYRKAKK